MRKLPGLVPKFVISRSLETSAEPPSLSRLHYRDSDAYLDPLMVRGSHPRRSVCDDVAGEALDATRLWRVLHCVPVPGATQASLGMPQASSPPPIAHTGGGEASAGTRKGLLTWLPSDP